MGAVAPSDADRLGSAGTGLQRAAEHAFESGMQTALLISAGLLLVGAIYTWVRGPVAVAAPEQSSDASIAVEAEIVVGAPAAGS